MGGRRGRGPRHRVARAGRAAPPPAAGPRGLTGRHLRGRRDGSCMAAGMAPAWLLCPKSAHAPVINDARAASGSTTVGACRFAAHEQREEAPLGAFFRRTGTFRAHNRGAVKVSGAPAESGRASGCRARARGQLLTAGAYCAHANTEVKTVQDCPAAVVASSGGGGLPTKVGEQMLGVLDRGGGVPLPPIPLQTVHRQAPRAGNPEPVTPQIHSFIRIHPGG